MSFHRGSEILGASGCRYDIISNRAQCETGSCADQYDCSSAAQVDAGFTSLTEWTFYQPTSDPTIFVDNPDISLVDGSSLNVDIEPVDVPGLGGQEAPCPAGPLMGQKKCSPLGDHTDQGWLMYNYPLTVHGADLRANNPGTNQNCTDANGNSFVLKRSDINKTGGYFGFVIEDGNGNPVMPPGDYPLACFNNCGMYEFGGPPSGSCDPFTNDDAGKKCYGWNVFCAGDGSNYGNTGCKSDKDCIVKYKGQDLDVHASCYNNNPALNNTACSLRAFYQTPDSECPLNQLMGPHDPGSPASLVACTFTYGSSNPLITAQPPANYVYGAQPPAAPCADVIGPDGKPTPCIGDDTVHQVFHGGYTWPNDPEVFGGDSPLYRVIFAPGGTSVPITPATNGIPLCSELPSNYNFTQHFASCSTNILNEGAELNIARDKGGPWSCSIGSQAADSRKGVLCRWYPAPTTQSGCSPPLTDQYVTNSTCGLSASGISLVSSSFKPNMGDPLFFEVAIATPDPAKAVNPPDKKNISGCVPSSGPGSWSPVPEGSLSFGSQTNPNQGYVAWYSGTSNNDGKSGSQCQVTVTLAESAAATLKVYDVPAYNGTPEITSTASGSYNFNSPKPGVFAQTAPVKTTHQIDLLLGSLLQVNQQLSPITYWVDWLTSSITWPTPVNCDKNHCPTQDGTDYLSGSGPYSSNADAGHQIVGPGKHALERTAEVKTAFNWGGVAIYIELTPTPLALTCASSSAQAGVAYASPLLASGGTPPYTFAITTPLPAGLNWVAYNGYIYGTPTIPGTYPYTAGVTDSASPPVQVKSNCSIVVSQ